MDEVVSASREMIRVGSRSFAGAARLLDPEIRDSVYQLYAWCRHCDDRIDGQELGRAGPDASPEGVRARLEEITRLTDSALAGERTDDVAFVALQRVVDRHGIPHDHPRALVRGFAMDAEGRRYHHLDDVLDYCYHVAGVVGVMMAYVMGATGSAALDRAADLGIGLQMTNIARDVLDDARAGRVYLPLDWLAEAGVPAREITEPWHRAAVARVVRRFLARADRYYESALAGLPFLSLRAAWSIATARRVYRDIGRIVLKRGPRAWERRVVVGKGRKLVGVAGGAMDALVTRVARRAAPSREGLWTRPRPEEEIPNVGDQSPGSSSERTARSFSTGGA